MASTAEKWLVYKIRQGMPGPSGMWAALPPGATVHDPEASFKYSGVEALSFVAGKLHAEGLQDFDKKVHLPIQGVR